MKAWIFRPNLSNAIFLKDYLVLMKLSGLFPKSNFYCCYCCVFPNFVISVENHACICLFPLLLSLFQEFSRNTQIGIISSCFFPLAAPSILCLSVSEINSSTPWFWEGREILRNWTFQKVLSKITALKSISSWGGAPLYSNLPPAVIDWRPRFQPFCFCGLREAAAAF